MHTNHPSGDGLPKRPQETAESLGHVEDLRDDVIFEVITKLISDIGPRNAANNSVRFLSIAAIGGQNYFRYRIADTPEGQLSNDVISFDFFVPAASGVDMERPTPKADDHRVIFRRNKADNHGAYIEVSKMGTRLLELPDEEITSANTTTLPLNVEAVTLQEVRDVLEKTDGADDEKYYVRSLREDKSDSVTGYYGDPFSPTEDWDDGNGSSSSAA